MQRTNPETEEIHPRSHPEDRQEGSFNPDPNLECWTCVPDEAAAQSADAGHPVLAAHAPSGEVGDDDGAGNPSPRGEDGGYGQEDADQGHLGAT